MPTWIWCAAIILVLLCAAQLSIVEGQTVVADAQSKPKLGLQTYLKSHSFGELAEVVKANKHDLVWEQDKSLDAYEREVEAAFGALHRVSSDDLQQLVDAFGEVAQSQLKTFRPDDAERASGLVAKLCSALTNRLDKRPKDYQILDVTNLIAKFDTFTSLVWERLVREEVTNLGNARPIDSAEHPLEQVAASRPSTRPGNEQQEPRPKRASDLIERRGVSIGDAAKNPKLGLPSLLARGLLAAGANGSASLRTGTFASVGSDGQTKAGTQAIRALARWMSARDMLVVVRCRLELLRALENLPPDERGMTRAVKEHCQAVKGAEIRLMTAEPWSEQEIARLLILTARHPSSAATRSAVE